MKAYKGVLTSPTATGNQSITGLGFQPKVILFWATRNTAHGFSAATIQQMFGVAVSSTQRWVYVGASDNAAAASNAGRASFNTQCIRMFSAGTPTLDAVADFVSHDADGFTINWSDAPSTAILVHYLALGGASLNVFAGSSATPSANGNASYTGVGFQPGFVLTAYNVANVGSNFTEHNLTLGFASASTAQGAAAIRDRDAQATMDVVNRQVTDKVLCASLSTSTSDVSHAALASFDTDGFTLTWSAGPISSEAFCYLCLGGESFKVGAETQNTSTGTKATTGVGFKPAALFAIGWNKAANTALDTSDMRLTIGAADGTREGHTWIQSADATADSDTDQRSSDTKFLGFCTQPTTVNAECDVSTMDTDGYTLDWTTADTTARQFIYAAFGPFEGGTTFAQALSATATGSASMVRRPGIGLSAAATGAASMVRAVRSTLSAAATGTASIVRQARLGLAASATGTATLVASKTILQTIAATATGTATMTLRVGKLLSAAATGSPTMVRQSRLGLAASAAGTAGMVRRVGKGVAVTAVGTASIARRISMTMSTAATGSASIVKRTTKILASSASGLASLVAENIGVVRIGRNRLGDAAGAGGTRSVIAAALGGLGRSGAGTPGASPGRGSSGSAGAGGARGTPGSAGSAGGRT